MSTFRRSTSTETSSSSSGSTTGSSSCSNSGSSSSEESETSSSEDKSLKAAESAAKSRRKSSDFRTGGKNDVDKHNDDVTPVKKITRTVNVPGNAAKRKTSTATATATASAVSGQSLLQKSSGSNSRHPPPQVKSSNARQQNHSSSAEGGENASHKNMSALSPISDDSEKEVTSGRNKVERKIQPKPSILNSTSVNSSMPVRRTKLQPKRNTSTRNVSKMKSSEESDSESGKSTSSTESDASDSSVSFTSHPAKAVKGKRAPTTTKIMRSDSDEEVVTPRKLTRSLSNRRSKQALRHGGGVGGTDSDSDVVGDLDGDKRSLSKSPAKKPTSVSKCKVKKEGGNVSIVPPKPRSLSPPQHVEKKCPIEGCDSSGHLSGNLDRHFLPEACPIYHNMSASECKERANERKLRDERRQKMVNSTVVSTALNTSDSSNSKMMTIEQKEFLSKIRESRAHFRPSAATVNAEKVKMEKDCTDEDREPSLAGLVPDYDLQLFREAQAIASEKIEEELKDLPVGKGIKYITMGKYKMKVWYQSPYPDDAARLPKIYICEFCLRYQKSETGIKRHAQKCIWRHPPGDEIYRKGKLQVWQVDGKRHKQYCQHLCLLAKFFLDHKTLYYDVEPFLFYIMTLADVDGCHTVGYFSKEKNSFYNVSCILTLPPYQRKGYGRLLIDFSYLLTRVEGKIGSPEKPLSDLGLISYRSYWKDVLLDYLCKRSGNTLSIKDVSQEMAIYSYDIVSTLQALGMMKYWKGKHIVLKKQEVLDEYEERVKRRGNLPKIDDSCLRWSPFVPTQSNKSP